MRNTIKALGDNAKFYHNYMANNLAADFKFHLDKGIGRIIENNSRLTEENAKLREVLESIVSESERSWVDLDACIVDAKQLLNQLKGQNNDE